MDWITATLVSTLLSMTVFFIGTAVLLVFLSFGPWTGRFVSTFRGLVGPFFGATTLILGILIGFLANDIWDRNRRAATAIKSEAEDLVEIVRLAQTFDMPADPVVAAVRSYAEAVVRKEWPQMAQGESAPEAERALGDLLRAVARPVQLPGSNLALDKVLLDTALSVRTDRNTRLALSRDESASVKWVAVIVLAVLSQISVAAVHLEKPRPQILALAIYTCSLLFIFGLLAAHELPFEPPNEVTPAPIAHVLDLVPAGKSAPAQ
jgi:hypothetical protein